MSDIAADASQDGITAPPLFETNVIQMLSGTVAPLGLVLAAAPFIVGATGITLWNNVAIGAGIFLLSAFNAVRDMRNQSPSFVVAVLTVLLAVWAIVAPVFLPLWPIAFVVTNVLMGVFVILFSGYIAHASR